MHRPFCNGSVAKLENILAAGSQGIVEKIQREEEKDRSMVRAAILSCGAAKPQDRGHGFLSSASSVFSTRGDQEQEEDDRKAGGGDDGDGDGDEEVGDVEMKVEDIRLEQQISHGAVEVFHTCILCTDLDHFFCRSRSRSRIRIKSSRLDPRTVSSESHGDGDGDDLSACRMIPGFSAVGTITELGSGVLTHHIGQRVAYCTFPIAIDSEPPSPTSTSTPPSATSTLPPTTSSTTSTLPSAASSTTSTLPSASSSTAPSTTSTLPSASSSTASSATSSLPPTSSSATSTLPPTSSSTTSSATSSLPPTSSSSATSSLPPTSSSTSSSATSSLPSTTSSTTPSATSTLPSTSSSTSSSATSTLPPTTPSTTPSATSTLPPTSSSTSSSTTSTPSPASAWHYKHCCSVGPSLWAPVGAYCEARIVPVDRLIPLPDDVDDHTMATILFPGLIARALVHEGTRRWRSARQNTIEYTIESSGSSTTSTTSAAVAATDSHNHHNITIPKVLVYPAMGVLGSLVCQLAAHHDQGALVIGVVPAAKATSTASASSFVMPVLSEQECSRQVVFNPDRITKFTSQIQSGFRGHASIVYDLSGEITPLQSCLDCLESGGVYVSLERLLQTLRKIENRHDGRFIHEGEELPGKRTWVKMHLFNYVRNGKDLIHNAFELIELCRQKKLKCPIVNEYPLESVLQAHKDVQSQAQAMGGLGICLLKPSVVDPQSIPDLS